MTETQALVCGSCGKPVSAADVVCPRCFAPLDAYRSALEPAVTSTLSPSIPSPTSPSMPTALAATPAPEPIVSPPSPIAEAMKRSERSSATPVDSADAMESLTEMANSDSSFARQIEAELKDAKAVFDDKNKTGASIQTAPGSAEVAAAQPVSKPARSGSLSPDRTLNPPQTPLDDRVIRQPSASSRKSAKNGINPVLIAVFLIFILTAFRNPSALLFLVVAIILVGIFFKAAISATKSNSRTTTRMPRDRSDRDNR